MTHEFRHPKFFKELRKRNKRAQAISEQASTEVDERSTGPGLRVTTHKLPGPRPISEGNKGLIHKQQARKRSSSQASSGARTNKRWI